jgi:hypothetical protein
MSVRALDPAARVGAFVPLAVAGFMVVQALPPGLSATGVAVALGGGLAGAAALGVAIYLAHQ